MHTNLGDGLVLVDGQFVSQKIQQVIQAIKEYEPDIEVKWIPERARRESKGDPLPAFQLIYAPVGTPPLTLFYVQSEEEFDMRVLQRIIVNDQRNGEVKWDDLRAFEEAAKLVAKQEYLDRMEEAEDMAKHILATPKHTYKVSDDLIIKDGIPFNARNLNEG